MEYPKIETLYNRDPVTFKIIPGQVRNRAYTLLKYWHWTEKVDGTNIRCIWKNGKLSFAGRTDAANLPGDLLSWLYANVWPVKLENTFTNSDLLKPADVVLYGEGYGAGIQKVGGMYSPTKKFILFDVLVDGKWWLNHEQICDVSTKLGLEVVPYFGVMSLEAATFRVKNGLESRLAPGGFLAEGLVGRPLETLFDKKGARLITKLKTKDFA